MFPIKVYHLSPAAHSPPFAAFMAGLEHKVRRKILTQLALLTLNPGMGEPHVKHFKQDRYIRLYELRTRSKVMLRIIFTFTEDGDILLLEPFIKRHKRNTMQALEKSLQSLLLFSTGSCSCRELVINPTTLEVIE